MGRKEVAGREGEKGEGQRTKGRIKEKNERKRRHQSVE